MESFVNVDSILALHKMVNIPPPKHPLISIIDLEEVKYFEEVTAATAMFNFYSISIKRLENASIRYGQRNYDFDSGTMSFVLPRQPTRIDVKDLGKMTGLLLLIHPDFIRDSPLGNTIKTYSFFSYEASEALHLSDGEKATITSLFGLIAGELDARIDDFSHDVIISYIQVLLNYSKRFYRRQFITRKPAEGDLAKRLVRLLDDYFDKRLPLIGGLPTVEYLASMLNISPRYLSDALRALTGQNAQQHIHEKLIDRAKEMLSSTNLTVSEIAYELGFEHSQSFNKLFKSKVKSTPLAYRQQVN